jgi:enoyl-CoA hydratase
LAGAARAMMLLMLANGPLALAACIDVADRGLDMTLEEGLALEAERFGALAGTSDMGEGTRAFLEKRPPQFTGA